MIKLVNRRSIRIQKDDHILREDLWSIVEFCLQTFSRVIQEFLLELIRKSQITTTREIFRFRSVIRFDESYRER